MSELLTFQKFCFLWRAPVNNSIDRTLGDLPPFIYRPSTSTFFLDAAKEAEILFVIANLSNCLFEQLNIHSSVDQFLVAVILVENTWS